MNWNLDDLYLGFDDVFEKDVIKLQSLISEYNNINFDNEKILIEYFSLQEKMTNLVRKLTGYCSLRTSTNVMDKEATLKMSILRNMLNTMTLQDVFFLRFLLTINLNEVIKELNLSHYEYVLKRMLNSAKRLLTEKEEVLYSKMKMVSSDSWGRLQKLLTSNLMCEYDNNEVTLSYIRNLAYENNQEVRKNAYLAEMKAYEKIEDTLALTLSNIKREVNIMTELRGYENALEKTLESSKMKKETLDAMLSAMRDSLPKFEEYFLAKSKYLNHNNGLPFYDLFAPIGSLDRNYSYEEAKEIIITNFNSFSSKLGDFAKKAFDNNWIDVEPYKGKVGGAFCANLPGLKQSRILTNFTGSLSDVSTLAHELGHGYHGDVISNNLPLNTSYPMPLAETASILCETIVMNNLMNNLEKDSDLLSVLEISLQGDSQVIVDIMSRYLFEEKVINETTDKVLDAKILKDYMLQAQKDTYGKGLDSEFMHPYMWSCKGHYYSAGLNFYNFPYAFGLLYAKGLYAKYLENKDEFIKNYDQMLLMTTVADVEDVALTMGIDVTKKEFWEASLKIIEKDIDKFIELSIKLK